MNTDLYIAKSTKTWKELKHLNPKLSDEELLKLWEARQTANRLESLTFRPADISEDEKGEELMAQAIRRQSKKVFIRFETDFAVAGITIQNCIVIDAPPIFRRWIGKPYSKMYTYYEGKGKLIDAKVIDAPEQAELDVG